ncbi:MAG: hypothetical protein Q9195_008455 [Heterodermia aff. obscurata]
MVQNDLVRASISNLVKSRPLVAVFVGGTSGIGEFTIQVLASAHGRDGKGLRVYIVGRNAAAAEKTIAECRTTCPGGEFIFVKANDLSLLGDVDRVCAEIIELEEKKKTNGEEPRIDILVMSTHYFPLLFEPRHDTTEGLDESFSLLYYSRMRFATKLLPLLLASPLPAHIISIYAAGRGSTLTTSDLSLRNPNNYTIRNLGSHAVIMKTFFMESLVERHPGKLSFVHIYPGLVMTGGFDDKRLPLWFRVAFLLLRPLLTFVITPGRVSGERVLFAATETFPAMKGGQGNDGKGREETRIGTDGVRGSGAYAVGSEMEPATLGKIYATLRADGAKEQVWEHTMSAFQEIEAGRKFTG